jgi:hypothetical protein
VHEFERQFRRKANVEAIIAGVLGLVVAITVHWVMFGRQPARSSLFETLIVLAVGGLWYHIRRVV